MSKPIKFAASSGSFAFGANAKPGKGKKAKAPKKTQKEARAANYRSGSLSNSKLTWDDIPD